MFKDVKVILFRLTRPTDLFTREQHPRAAVQVGGRIFIGQTDVTRRVARIV